MAKTATVTMEDPAEARIAVLERVRARRPPDTVHTYPGPDGSVLTSRSPAGADRLAPADLGQWCDDRVLATFGGRTRLNPGEQAAFEILEACRSGEPVTVAAAVRAAGERTGDGMTRVALYRLLEEWKSKAPVYAYEVMAAAAGEARRLDWDVLPRRARRRLAESGMAGA
jgi:hypothetical protein